MTITRKNQKNQHINGILKHLFALLVLLAVFVPSSAAYATTAYDAALEQLTDPVVQQTDDALRHTYSNDERISASAAGLGFLQKQGITLLWEINPSVMRTLSLARLEALSADLEEEEASDLPDVETVTDEELLSFITLADLTLSDPAPIFEQSWYDYGISASNTGYRYASKNISGYMFSVTCDGKYLALIKASYREEGGFDVSCQSYPNIYYNLYQTASQKVKEGSYPILLTDSEVHQAVAFLVPGGRHGTVYIKNAVSSSSKDEILDAKFDVFSVAAVKWNRDALSMLLDADGSIKRGAKLEYNNLESYVRSELRVAVKENLLRAACITVSVILAVTMSIMIANKSRIRFLDVDDPRRKWKYFLPWNWKK